MLYLKIQALTSIFLIVITYLAVLRLTKLSWKIFFLITAFVFVDVGANIYCFYELTGTEISK